MSNSQFISCTSAVVSANESKDVGAFLTSTAHSSAWVLARAAKDAVLEVQLLAQNGQPLSDISQIYSSGDVSRSKFLNVRIPVGSLPTVVKVHARNVSENYDAVVEGILLD